VQGAPRFDLRWRRSKLIDGPLRFVGLLLESLEAFAHFTDTLNSIGQS
jgi:hypothetical protein